MEMICQPLPPVSPWTTIVTAGQTVLTTYSSKYLWHMIRLCFLIFSKHIAGAEMWFANHRQGSTHLLC